MSQIIGLTGPTGSGKSTFAEVAAQMGLFVINCDASARKVSYRGGPLVKALCAAFGEDILDADGELDRAALAAKAFADARSTEKLNAVSLPIIADFVRHEIEAASAEHEWILLDAPTLFEAGLDTACDTVIALLADSEERKARIIDRDRLTIERAEERLSASREEDYYLSRAPHILYNNSTEDELRANARVMLEKITGGNRHGKHNGLEENTLL